MTYVAGGTLEAYWRSFGSNFVPVERAVEVIKQACRGLAVAHASSPPIVHRDIKPQNILVGYSGDGLHVRLSDFGLAKAVNPLTLLVSAKGTLGLSRLNPFKISIPAPLISGLSAQRSICFLPIRCRFQCLASEMSPKQLVS